MLNRIALFSLCIILAATTVRAQEDRQLPTSIFEKTHFGGYGEISLTKEEGSEQSKNPRLDIPRFVIYLDHYFTDKWALKSETEIEHVKLEASSPGGEVALEQLFLDYHASQNFGWRMGLILIPAGIINQTHEPTTFNGVERPAFDREVIPSTWREIGMGIYGDVAEGVKYQLLVTEGMNGLKFGTYGIAEGKQEGSGGTSGYDGSNAIHPAVSGKIEILPMTGLRIGGSFYVQPVTVGSNGISRDSLLSPPSGPLAAFFLDARFDAGALRLRAEGGIETLGDVEQLFQTTRHYLPNRVLGGYVEAAYDVMPLLMHDASSELSVFARFEHYTFDYLSLNEGILQFALGSITRNILTAGLSFKPIDEIVLKADWTNDNSSDAEKHVGTFRLGGGYSF